MPRPRQDNQQRYDEADERTYHAPRTRFSLQVENQSLAGSVITLIPPGCYPVEIAPAVASALDETVSRLRHMGASLIQKEPPFDLREITKVSAKILSAEAYALHREHVADMSLELDPSIRTRILNGASISAAEYIDAMNARRKAVREWDEWMTGIDALLLPATPMTACPVSEVDETQTLLSAFTRPANLIGACALAFPVGFDEDQLPIGMQFYGKAFDEVTLIDLGCAFQNMTDFHLRFPEI